MARKKKKAQKQKARRKLAVLGLLFTVGKGALGAVGSFAFKRATGG